MRASLTICARVNRTSAPEHEICPPPPIQPLTPACWFVCQLRDWLHVIANSKSSYELRYYNIHDQDADEDED